MADTTINIIFIIIPFHFTGILLDG